MKYTGALFLTCYTVLVGCGGPPPTTRTGEIHEVKIAEHVAPSEIKVQTGDEIRWVNHRSLPVQLDFLKGALDDVACERGFSNWVGMRRESIAIDPNQSASLCFSNSGKISYNVRMDSALPGGQQIEPGVIHVRETGKQ